MRPFFLICAIALLALTWITEIEGCHNTASGDGGDEDGDEKIDLEEFTRKKRQAPNLASETAGEVERTRLLRNYFSSCMEDRVGDLFNWDGVVDFTILDTRWYTATDNNTCRTDMPDCWKQRLGIYLRPDSNLMRPSSDCIDQLAIDVNATGRIFYRRRSKRTVPGYPSHTRRPNIPNPNNPDQLQDQYAACIQRVATLPGNRRPINLDSLVEFVENHAFCGECGVRSDPPQVPTPSSFRGNARSSRYPTSNRNPRYHGNSGSSRSSSHYRNSGSSGSSGYYRNSGSSGSSGHYGNPTYSRTSGNSGHFGSSGGQTSWVRPTVSSRIPSNLPRSPARYGPRFSSGRKKRSAPFSSTRSVRDMISSMASSYTPTDLDSIEEVGCTSATVYPFIFESLTQETSPLIDPISICNERFMDLFIPNPCADLKNRYGDAYCKKQQSWCDNYSQFVTKDCARTCCERTNRPVEDRPVPGWTEWTPWGDCPAPCGQRAMQVRRRMCPLGVPGLTPCEGLAVESRECEPEGCPSWSDWNSWSPCQITCGTLNQIASRTCIGGNPGEPGCDGRRMRSRVCNRGECFGTFSPWSSWSPCPVSCGSGTQLRRRTCEGNFRCLPDESDTRTHEAQTCNTNICPGRWSTWGSFSSCKVTCGGKYTYIRRTRRCIEGTVGGLGCEGSDIDRRECGRESCPEPVWADWGTWSNCNWRRRVRTCMHGPPGACPGENTDFGQCKGCKRKNEVHAHWGPWWAWSECRGACRGIRQRRRNCRRGQIGNPGCYGASAETQACVSQIACHPGK